MILSPPFLPDSGNLSEDAWLDMSMSQPDWKMSSTRAPEGSFPLSLRLGWHNGLHIQAPQKDGVYLPVRAVADGTVVFVRTPTLPNADASHPLNYMPYTDPLSPWTSDGFIVIRHSTEIGAAGSTPTGVTWFSACMHMDSIAHCPKSKSPWKAGDAVYRKDELGKPGRIYGHTGQIHFEISCDRANLQRLTTRDANWVNPFSPPAPTADGRTDSVFGSLYIYVPAGTPTSASKPALNITDAVRAEGGTPEQNKPNTLHAPQWVQISYDKGSATTRSYTTLGAPIGNVHTDANYEYDLYKEANNRHKSLSDSQELLSSPSGWYELLRFGRNLGPDALIKDAAHWRQIPTATGTIWADLNAKDTFKFSDADFPSVIGWNCFDDDTNPNDQRCDSDRMKNLIRDQDPTNVRRMEPKQLALRLGLPAVRESLRRTICHFPNEWVRETVAARYGWLKTEHFGAKEAGDSGTKNWERFLNHAEASCIPGNTLPADYLDANWRFHPREFVGVMRKCGWITTRTGADIYD
ncbi:MAG: hypothetical protein EON54_12850, partial [Alcaligenaceae bacterium]